MNDITTDTLQLFQAGQITLKECQARLAKTNSSAAPVQYKVSAKGAISFYGLRRMPITLYKSELDKIMTCVARCDEDGVYNEVFQSFLDDSADQLSVKVTKK